jgi:hypothetical protein
MLVSIVGLFLIICVIVVTPFLNYALLYWKVMAPTGRMKVWVKIVDQYGIPVKGYKLKIETTSPAIIPFSKPRYGWLWIESDENGMIYFDSKKKISLAYFGTGLDELAHKTPGYLPARGHGPAISYNDLYGNRHEERQEGAENAMPDAPNHPIIVTVYKHGPPEKLMFFGDGGQTKILNEGDRYVCINITEGKIWGSKTPESDIAVREIPKDEYQKLEPAESLGGYEFVAGKGAGIIQVWENYLVECPVNGYREILVFPRDFRTANGYATSTKVYFYCRDRKVYGFLDVGWINYERGDAALKYTANVSGSRCLYYDGYPNHPKEKYEAPVKMD